MGVVVPKRRAGPCENLAHNKRFKPSISQNHPLGGFIFGPLRVMMLAE
jgi:hypothetical protein